MKVALFSPMPPERSGIADYSALLLPALRARCEIAVVKRGAKKPPRGTDLCAYHIGNNPDAHGWIVEALRRTPGVVVLHDFVLHHLVAGLTIGRRDGHGYLDAMEREGGVVGRLLGHAVLDKRIPPLWENRPEDFHLAGEVLGLATGLIVHSHYVRDRSRAAGYEGPIWVVPHPAFPVPTLPAADVRGEPLFGSFGNVNASKRVPQLLEAFARVHAHRPGSGLLLVGATSPGFDLDRRLQRLGLDGAGIEREGYVEEGRLWQLMMAADVHVNLRSPTMGETSGTAIRALSLGKPLVVSDVGWFAELPDDVALKVPVDEQEIVTLEAALELLATRPDVRRAMGEAALELARGRHDVGRVAERYVSAFEQAAGGQTVDDAVLHEVTEAAAAVGIAPDSVEARELAARLSEVDLGDERLRAVPVWAWLALIVVGSAALRLWLVSGMAGPFIFVDELIYSELARSLAAGDGYSLRGLPTSGYSLLYPLLIAPAYALFDGLPDAYALAKSINAVAMSLAAVPAFVIARRVVRPSLALLAALTAVAVPSLAYTATLTTESLFYPVALAFVWLFLRYLEVPGWARLAMLMVGLAIALATRAQSLAFLPAIATAPLLLALFERRWRTVRPFVPLYGILVGAAILVVAVQAARGLGPTDLLGAYSIVGDGGYDAGSVARMVLWHLQELTLYAGILPIAALIILLSLSRGLAPRVQQHLAATASLLLWSTLAVAMFASRFASDRIQDRYLFFLVPVLVIVLLAWVEVGAPRPRVATTVAVVVALGLPLLFPFSRFISEPAKSDTVGLLPLWTINQHLVLGEYWATVALVGLGLVLVFLLVPARVAVVAPLAVLLLFIVVSRPVWSGPQGFRAGGAGALFQGIRGVERDWIDRAVPEGQEVVVLWTGRADRFTVNQNEFFNRRVGNIYYTGDPTPGGVNETPVSRVPDTGARGLRGGVFVLPTDGVIVAPYALLDGSITPDGVVVARDEELGTTLWRLTGPLSSRTTVTGIYDDGSWSGRTATWQLLRCRPGTLTTAVHSDPSLFETSQTVVAISGNRRAAVRFAPDERASLSIPVAPDERGTCVVRFVVTPTANPADVIPGSTDDRVLGVHFDAFAYEPR